MCLYLFTSEFIEQQHFIFEFNLICQTWTEYVKMQTFKSAHIIHVQNSYNNNDHHCYCDSSDWIGVDMWCDDDILETTVDYINHRPIPRSRCIHRVGVILIFFSPMNQIFLFSKNNSIHRHFAEEPRHIFTWITFLCSLCFVKIAWASLVQTHRSMKIGPDILSMCGHHGKWSIKSND